MKKCTELQVSVEERDALRTLKSQKYKSPVTEQLHLKSSCFRICFLVVLVWFCCCGWLVEGLVFLILFFGVVLFYLFILHYHYCFNAH